MKNKLNKLKSFLGFSAKSSVTLTSSTLVLGCLTLSISLLTTPSKSVAQSGPILKVPVAKPILKVPVVSLSKTLLSYCSDLASWANSDSSSSNHYLGVTVVTNNQNGIGRLYTGSTEKVSNFLGRADQLIFNNGGSIYTNRLTGNQFGGYAPLPYKGGFAWVCNAPSLDGLISINYPEYTSGVPPLVFSAPARTDSFKVKNIRLVNNLLYGQVVEADGSISEAIISFQKYSDTIVIVK